MHARVQVYGLELTVNPSTIELTILFDFGGHILPVSQVMRLLAEIVIIAALISLGWNKPLKEQVGQANTTFTSK